ncbi:MAG: pyruvate kinase [Phycisphaerales bacterium]
MSSNATKGGPRTRIVVTIGPACDSAAQIHQLIEAGAGVLRLNMSHGSLETHQKTVATIRQVESECGVPIAIMADLPGPKIRLAGAVPERVETGAEVTIVGPDELIGGDTDALGIDVRGVLSAVKVGHRVLIDDGNIGLLVIAIEGDGDQTRVRCVVTSGGGLRIRNGVNVPDSDPDLPAVTDRDLEFAHAMTKAGVEFLAVSFCRDGDDLRRLRSEVADGIDPDGILPGVVAKVERPAAVANLMDVIEASDAVLVARGDLGVEMDIAEVPVVQKRIVSAAVSAGRPVIVATQMLQSMIEAASPTRAEATDVANAILDGTDALMLSGETAIGRHPPLAVKMLQRIAVSTEAWMDEREAPELTARTLVEIADPWMPAIARGARRIAADLGAVAVLAWSRDEHTACLLSRERFKVPIIMFTDDVRLARRMRLLRGVRPVVTSSITSRSEFLRIAAGIAVADGVARIGEACVFVHGSGRNSERPTDAIGVLRIGDESENLS